MTYERIFDAHLHIIDPVFPIIPNNGYVPEAFTVDQYLAQLASMGLEATGGAVVSGSFQADDQTYLKAALGTLGVGWVGVTQLPAVITDDELADLERVGVRAIRFNLTRGPFTDLDVLVNQALRVHDLFGWHAEAYINAADLPDLADKFGRLPRLSIDHLGLSGAGSTDLLSLVDRGVRVKATGFGRVDFDVAEMLKSIDRINPEALLFGTDLPSTRAPRPFLLEDVQLLQDALGGDGFTRAISTNARSWYRVGAFGTR